eukprot:4066555-Prymnesium_polylepis.1
MSASSGRPSVLRTTWTCSTDGERYDHVRSEPPCTRMGGASPTGPPVGETLPRISAVPTPAVCCICIRGDAMRRAGAAAWGASSRAELAANRESIFVSASVCVSGLRSWSGSGQICHRSPIGEGPKASFE